MFSQKAYLARWMAQTTKMAPFTYSRIYAVLRASAAAAALQCCGGTSGRMCGLSWVKGSAWDGTMGVGQQMAALEAVQSTLIAKVAPPLTNSTGGTSVGNPGAGGNGVVDYSGLDPPTRADKIGAGVLSAVVVIMLIGTFSYMSF